MPTFRGMRGLTAREILPMSTKAKYRKVVSKASDYSSRSHYEKFAEVYNDWQKYPTDADVAKFFGIAPERVKNRLRNYLGMQKRHPEMDLPPILDRKHSDFEKGFIVFFEDYLRAEEYRIDMSKLGGKGRYVITSAMYNGDLCREWWTTLKRYAKDMNATLVVLPTKYGTSLEQLPEQLKGYVCFEDAMLNSVFRINATAHIRPTTLHPLRQVRATRRNLSEIIASPKVDLNFVPVSNNTLPKVTMTTGSCTYPNYNPGMIGAKAEKQHLFGAVVVEIVDDTTFHFRQLIADEHFGVCDINLKYYHPGGVRKIDAIDTLVTGDWHTWQTCPVVRQVTYGADGIVARLKPKFVIKHDLFDGTSISHHNVHDRVLLAQLAAEGKLSLKAELEANVDEVAHILQSTGDALVAVVRSNHDEHLDRYLTEARYMNDAHNYRVGHELVPPMVDGMMPFEWYVRKRIAERIASGELKMELATAMTRLKFLIRDEDFYRHGIQLGMHGDKGANGARGSLQQFLKGVGPTVTGHNHTPMIDGPNWVVGTSTRLKLQYTKGLSSWCNSHVVIFPNGQRMMINIIQGAWFMA